ncbi:hypothetical protein LYSHEL_03910 [Lysobacter helvus]|uniref:Secreted protein n=2 Tax=Lysobacteraceae TaxID=32033 RepID=A0ABM7Q2G1_9GAMM|nr:hypothetical protein LYSCAS_03910 [Lysobacter caseinilyticus]BCT94520.1 hypothetical protein LYSHEL_03910 [Lysobacter helvus]
MAGAALPLRSMRATGVVLQAAASVVHNAIRIGRITGSAGKGRRSYETRATTRIPTPAIWHTSVPEMHSPRPRGLG